MDRPRNRGAETGDFGVCEQQPQDGAYRQQRGHRLQRQYDHEGQAGNAVFGRLFQEATGPERAAGDGGDGPPLQGGASITESEVLVAGYMPRRGCKNPCLFNVDTKQPDRVRRISNPCVTWAGQSDVVDRIFGRGMTIRDGRKKVQILEYLFMFQDFSLQDAVDLSVLCIEMTYRTMRFQDREQTVGPSIDVLVIAPDGGRWFRKREIGV